MRTDKIERRGHGSEHWRAKLRALLGTAHIEYTSASTCKARCLFISMHVEGLLIGS